MTDTARKYSDFINLVKQWDYLESMGYTDFEVDIIPQTKIMPDVLRISAKSKNHRMITLNFFCEGQKENVTVSVFNISNNSYYNIRDWLNYHKLPVAFENFRLSSYEGDFCARANGFLKWLQETFDHPNLKSDLAGDTWECVPFDWAGMR